MSFKAAKCPNCAGDLQVPDDRDSVKCMYCGSDIIVREAIKAAVAGVNIENLLSLAKAAFKAENFKEAFDYYTRVLEVDVQNYEAWLGKGLSAGWMSTLAEFRFSEMINGIDKALEYAPDDKKDELKLQTSYHIGSIASACYQMAMNHRMDYGSLENVRVAFIFQCEKLIEVHEYAYNMEPTNVMAVSDIISMCERIIESYTAMSAPESSYIDIREKLNTYISKMKILNPEMLHCHPEINKSSSTDAKCFVATVTMGNANHPIVVLLREFRDAWLLERKYGKIFIKCYYKIGPYVALIINKRPYLKHISYMIIIRPAAYITGLLLRK